MKKFTIKSNNYLNQDIVGYYNCDYIGYQKENNPDFINHLKNMSASKSELDLVGDFIELCDILSKDLQDIIINKENKKFTICVIPRSKAEKTYKQSQLMFSKAVSSIANKLNLDNATNAIIRTKDTKTTHDWRLANNSGDSPYTGITEKTCEVDKSKIIGKDILLVDDIYTEGVNVAEDCIQLLLNLGAKSCILYVVAKTRS